MKTYRAKTGVVDAWEINEDTKDEFVKWLEDNYEEGKDFGYNCIDNEIATISIKTMYGTARLLSGDIVVVYRDGQMSIYNKEEFEKIFEEMPSEEGSDT